MRRFFALSLSAMIAIAVILPGIAGAEEGEGKALYDKKCALCHGKDGIAKKMAEGSANLNDPEWQKSTSVDAVVAVIKDGKGKMPKNEGKLTPEEMKAIAGYVMTLGK